MLDAVTAGVPVSVAISMQYAERQAANAAAVSVMDKVLIIDDDVELCELIAEFLKQEGFKVAAVHDPEVGLAKLAAEPFSIVILDVMLPKFTGFELLRRLRSTQNNVPVLLLTARGDEVDRIVGLEIGADDYLPKPFNTRELTARIRAILRRVSQQATSGAAVLRIDDIELNPNTRTAKRQNKSIELTSLEFDLLRELMAHAGQVVTREEISANVLGRPFSPFDRSIDMHISKLRRKLGEKRGEELIKTIRNSGYLFPLASGG